MADIARMKKIVPLIMCEISFGQFVCGVDFWCQCNGSGSLGPN